MKRRFWIGILALLLCLCCLTGCTKKAGEEAANTPAPQTGMISPVHQVEDYVTLLVSGGGAMLSDAPEGATNVVYQYIDGIPIIAEIRFTYNGHDYTYRAANTTDETYDISGVYETFDKNEELINATGAYMLRSVTGRDLAVANWYNAGSKCVYTLYSPTAGGQDQPIADVADLLMPVSVSVNGQELTAATPEPTATPKPTTYVINGTVNQLEDNALLVNVESGETVSFLLSYVDGLTVGQGDAVQIVYTGELTDAPQAITVTVVEKAAVSAKTASSVSGTVYSFDNDSLFVQTTADDIYGFWITKATKYDGEARILTVGNTVTVYYTGDLSNGPSAQRVETTAMVLGAAAGETPAAATDAKLQNKRLKGQVTELSSKSITILTGSGNRYTFWKDSSSLVTGTTALTKYCTVRITYDGYAADSPYAKKLQVLAAPDPTPTNVRTITGTVTMQAGNALVVQLDSGATHSFLLGAPAISGSGGVGSRVRVTYEINTNNVTKLVYEKPVT